MGGGPAAVWEYPKGFLTQSVTPSSYGSNFPTTGAHNLYFDLDISGSNQALSWAPVSHGGITATMTDSTSTSVRVTLTGPVVTDANQWQSENPGEIDRPSLPQVFELVGRDSSGNAVVKYGFELKQWFVNRGNAVVNYSSMNSWCNKIGGYRLPKVKDLTNATCHGNSGGNVDYCQRYANEVDAIGATPSSSGNLYMRYIGAGFFSEWGWMDNYGANNFGGLYQTQERAAYNSRAFLVYTMSGSVTWPDSHSVKDYYNVFCVYP